MMHAKRFQNRLMNGLLAVALIAALLVTSGVALQSPSHAVSAAPAALEANGSLKPLLTSAARTTSGTSAWACGLAPFQKYAMQLLVTAHAGTTPTLDVSWEHSIDGGTTAFSVTTFTQVTTTDGNQLKVESEVQAATAEVYGDCMRAKYVIAGTTPSYTFQVDLFVQ